MKYVRIITYDKEGMIHDIKELSASRLYRKNGDCTSFFSWSIRTAIEDGHHVGIEKGE